MGGTVSQASLRSWTLTPVAAPVRSCALHFGVSSDLLWWMMEMAALRMARLAATRWVCMGELCDAHHTFLRAPVY